MGNHSCEYFCVYCQIDDKNKLSEDGTSYRTRYSINRNAELYRDANDTNPNSTPSPLQISKGVKGYFVDPYPESSRISPPLLQIDICVIYMINISMRSADPILVTNRYMNNNWNGIKYSRIDIIRLWKNFSVIVSIISSSTFYICMNGVVETQCEEEKRILNELNAK